MKNKLLFGIALFVVIFMSYMGYSSALDSSDTTRLVRAINNLSDSVDTLNSSVRTLNSRVDTLSSKIGTWSTSGSLTSEIDDLGKDLESLESGQNIFIRKYNSL